MTSNTNTDNVNAALSQNINNNSNESKNSNSKKKEQPPQETFYNLCQSLLRFINRKIVKKYVFPNVAQLPKEKRGLDLRANNEWKYYLNKNVSEEEKIRDVFKDDYFLSSLQKMTNSLNEVIDYIELNQKKINMIDVKSRNKEERHNSLSELRNLIDNYLENVDKEDNNDINKSENDEGPLKNINEKINEKINELYTLQKYIDGAVDNNNNMSNENLAKNDESTIKEENVSVFNINNESSEKNQKNFGKKEIDILIQNFRLEKINGLEKSNEKILQEKKEDIKDENIFLNKKTERESKTKNGKNKNKKKKAQKKEENEENKKDDINTNEIKNEEVNKVDNPAIKLQTIPILRPKEDKININNIEIKERKKDDDIDEEILQQLLKEEEDNKNNEEKNKNKNKKEVINIDTIPNNSDNNIKSVEEMFDLELKKHYSENQRDKKNKMSIIIKSIIFTLNDNKILGIKKYNDRISGPYLAGSYKAFPDLCLIDYPGEIDIIYKYKNMLLNKEAIDFSVKEVLEKYLELNIIKMTVIPENESMMTKVETECGNKKWGNNNSIKFNILFIDAGHEFNEKIIDQLILTKRKFPVKTDAERFLNICLFLRFWRRKYKLYYLIPEILDELVRKYITQDKTTLTIVLNVFYELFNKMPEFTPDRNDDFISRQIMLMEEIMDSVFSKDNNQRIEELVNILFKETEDLNNKKFDEVFKV